MMVFVMILFISLIFQYFSRIVENDKISNFLDFLSITFMFVMAGLRFDVGRDFWGYYSSMASRNYSVEFGTRYLINIVQYFRLDMQVFIFTLSFLTGLFFYLTIKYHDKFKKTRYIYIILLFSLLFFSSLNISRQILAASIFAYSTKFIYERKIIKYVIFILIATSFHITAIFLLIIYPVSILFIKIKNKKTLLNFILVISMFNMFIPFISNWMKSLTLYITSSMGKYNVYTDRIITEENYFSNFNLLVAILLFLLININDFNKNTVREKNFYYSGMFMQFMAVLFILSNSILNFSTLTMRFYYYFTLFLILCIGNYKYLFYTGNRYINTLYKIIVGTFVIISTTNSLLSAINNTMLNLYPFSIKIFDIIVTLK